MSRFDHRKYKVILALGQPIRPSLYSQEGWQRLFPTLDPLVQSVTRQPDGVRSTQIDVETGSQIRFGRMRWNQKSHDRWMLEGTSDRSGFVSTEVWAPSWTVCEREDLAPDVFVQIVNISTIDRDCFLVAVCEDVVTNETDGQLHEVALACESLLEGVLLVQTERFWGRSVLNNFRDSIQDYWAQIAHALRDDVDGATVDSLPGEWKAVSLAD